MDEPIKELGGRAWAELEVLEHDQGQLMFPAELRRRTKTGETKVVKVRVRVPSPEDTFAARREARKECAKRELDEKEDRDLFRQLEQLVLLSFAIREFNTGGQFAKIDELVRYDEACLRDIQNQINRFKTEQEPCDAVVTEEDFWRKTIEVARGRDIGPLGDMPGPDQHACVIRMASEACRSPTGLSWLRSFGISIPESSPSKSSDES